MRPDVLYKYRPIWPGEARCYTERIFTRLELYFSLPAQFNDPFECRIRLSFLASPADLEAAVSSGKLSAESAAAIRHSATDPAYQEDLERVGREVGKSLPKTCAVLCLTQRCDHVLMWSHYASSHRGLCIGFDSRQDFFRDAKPVEYRDELPTVNYVRQSVDEFAATALLTKATKWAYEQEWRLAGLSRRGRLITYSPRALREVIFGSCITPDDRNHFSDLARSVRRDVRLFQAQLAEDDYRLLVKEL